MTPSGNAKNLNNGSLTRPWLWIVIPSVFTRGASRFGLVLALLGVLCGAEIAPLMAEEKTPPPKEPTAEELMQQLKEMDKPKPEAEAGAPAKKKKAAKFRAIYVPKHWADPATGIALGGFDPIVFFEQQTLQAGDEDFEYEWHGVSWRFISKGNMKAFKRSPTLYAPVFAGYDPYAISQNILAEGQPAIWAILEGRLYLFHSPVNKHLWTERSEQLKPAVTKNWQKLSQDLPRFKLLMAE